MRETIQYLELSVFQCSVDEIVKRVLSGRSVFEWDTLWGVGAQEKNCSTLPLYSIRSARPSMRVRISSLTRY